MKDSINQGAVQSCSSSALKVATRNMTGASYNTLVTDEHIAGVHRSSNRFL